MPTQRRRPAGPVDTGARLPPEPKVNLEEAAPQGSAVRRTGPRRPEVLPPGRRNQPDPAPARPSGAFTPVDSPVDDGPEPEITDDEIRRRAAAKLAQRFGDAGAPQAEAMSTTLTDPLVDFEQVGPPVNQGAFEGLATALIDGINLVTEGGTEDDVEQWVQTALNALHALAPVDPLANLDPVTEFLWGAEGVLRDTPPIGE